MSRSKKKIGNNIASSNTTQNTCTTWKRETLPKLLFFSLFFRKNGKNWRSWSSIPFASTYSAILALDAVFCFFFLAELCSWSPARLVAILDLRPYTGSPTKQGTHAKTITQGAQKKAGSYVVYWKVLPESTGLLDPIVFFISLVLAFNLESFVPPTPQLSRKSKFYTKRVPFVAHVFLPHPSVKTMAC